MSIAQTFLNKVPRDTISGIDDDLDLLEELLEPILSKPMDQTLEKLSILERAKFHTLVPYVINDLIIMYLKLNGVDLKGHPVMEEMKRVKSYFEKIHTAEHETATHATVDKVAVSRFIKHAIASATGPPKLATASSSTTDGVIGSHLRFDVTGVPMSEDAAAKIAARNESPSSDEDSDEADKLEVVEGDLADKPEEETLKEVETEEAGNDTPPENLTSGSKKTRKRRRATMDPFAGYDIEPAASTSRQPSSEDSLQSSKKKRKKRGKKGKNT